MGEQANSVGRLDRVEEHALLERHLLVVQRLFLLEGKRGGRAAPEPRQTKRCGLVPWPDDDGRSAIRPE